MTYEVKRQNENHLDEPFRSKIINAYTKDKTEVNFNTATATIENVKVLDGVTTIFVRVE